MKKLLITLALLGFAGLALASPTYQIVRGLVPETIDTYSLGLENREWLHVYSKFASTTGGLSISGEQATPYLHFIGDTDTGIGQKALNNIDFYAGGSSIASMNTTGLCLTGTCRSTWPNQAGAATSTEPLMGSWFAATSSIMSSVFPNLTSTRSTSTNATSTTLYSSGDLTVGTTPTFFVDTGGTRAAIGTKTFLSAYGTNKLQITGTNARLNAHDTDTGGSPGFQVYTGSTFRGGMIYDPVGQVLGLYGPNPAEAASLDANSRFNAGGLAEAPLTAAFAVQAKVNTDRGFVVKAKTGQTGNLFEALNPSNANIMSIAPTGTTTVTTSLSNATSTFILGKSGQNKGSCLELYDAAGTVVYAYIKAGDTAFTLSSTNCHRKPDDSIGG